MTKGDNLKILGIVRFNSREGISAGRGRSVVFKDQGEWKNGNFKHEDLRPVNLQFILYYSDIYVFIYLSKFIEL